MLKISSHLLPYPEVRVNAELFTGVKTPHTAQSDVCFPEMICVCSPYKCNSIKQTSTRKLSRWLWPNPKSIRWPVPMPSKCRSLDVQTSMDAYTPPGKKLSKLKNQFFLNLQET
ncbi:uncharacterized protein LOC113220340 isoform X2 [Piliocolobus tephrosceles]|uniref:uncharacterized protein LOC113220340 isoform X2 n=1 Tax=Piliocolobus tephrosceles TaxID=591936 RepID=UPI000E6B3D6F|nr:uncharacterized protein LOC113220340 isoform X2 [Piliocolobus tephrosceles]